MLVVGAIGVRMLSKAIAKTKIVSLAKRLSPIDFLDGCAEGLALKFRTLATKRKPRALTVYKGERRDVSVSIKGFDTPKMDSNFCFC